MNAQEARELVNKQDMNKSPEVIDVYNAINEHIKNMKPAPGSKVTVQKTTKMPMSPAAKKHLEDQGYEVKTWGGSLRDEGDYYYSVTF